MNHDEFANGSTSAQGIQDGEAASAELDVPPGGSTSPQVTPDDGLGLSSLNPGFWLALGLPLLLLPFLFLLWRRRKKESQQRYAW